MIASLKPIVFADIPDSKCKPRVYYNVSENMMISGSGYKKYLKKSDYDKAYLNYRLMVKCGSPLIDECLVEWDSFLLEMRFKSPLGPTTMVPIELTESKDFLSNKVLMLDRRHLGQITLKENKDILTDLMISSLLKHLIIAYCLGIPGQNPTKFIMKSNSNSRIFTLDYDSNRSKINLESDDLLDCLMCKSLGKRSKLRKQCENYINQKIIDLIQYIQEIPDSIINLKGKGTLYKNHLLLRLKTKIVY